MLIDFVGKYNPQRYDAKWYVQVNKDNSFKNY